MPEPSGDAGGRRASGKGPKTAEGRSTTVVPALTNVDGNVDGAANVAERLR